MNRARSVAAHGQPPTATAKPRVALLPWVPGYQRAWLASDTAAGLTIWALIVPEAMAHASLAGLPVQYGLYSVPLAVLGYAVFGSSRQLVVGPSSTVAILSGATVAPVAAAGSDGFIALTAALSILVGALYVVLGLLRFGFIARFFAKPVLDGFIVGLGIYIVVGQLHKLTGTSKGDGDTPRQLWNVLSDLESWSWVTVGVGAAALVLLFGLERASQRIPGALVVGASAIAAAAWLDLGDHGVDLVGDVPTGFGFVAWSAIGWNEMTELVPGALGIIVVGFAQSIAIAKALAAERGEHVSANAEMIGYGAASIGAGALQGYAPTGSLSKSAAARGAGARTPFASLIAGVLVVLTVLFLAGLFEQLPEAVLGAIVIHAVSGMIDLSKLTRLFKAGTPDFWLALAALLGVVLVGILAGIVIGVGLSLVMFVHRLDHPHVAVLGRRPDGTFVDVAAHADAVAVPGVVVHRIEAPLIFANADVVTDDITAQAAASEPSAATAVLDFESVFEIDTTGVDALLTLRHELAGRGTTMLLARPRSSVLTTLRATGALATIGEGNVHPTVEQAVEAGAHQR